MSVGQDLALQGAIVAKLKADSTLQALVGNPIRLYQDVPAPAALVFPYLTIGDSQSVPDQVQFLDSSELFHDIHIWSRSHDGFVECKKIVAAVDAALNDATLALTENRCVEIERDGARVFMDQDNVTKHGVVTFRALTEPA